MDMIFPIVTLVSVFILVMALVAIRFKLAIIARGEGANCTLLTTVAAVSSTVIFAYLFVV